MASAVNNNWTDASLLLTGTLFYTGTVSGMVFGAKVGTDLGIAAGIAVSAPLCAVMGPLGVIPAVALGITAAAVAAVALGVLGAVAGALCSLLAAIILNLLLIVVAAIRGQNRETLKTMASIPFEFAREVLENLSAYASAKARSLFGKITSSPVRENNLKIVIIGKTTSRL